MPPRCDIESAPVLRQCLRATRALAELKDAGILSSEMAGRERIYVNLALLDLLKEGRP
ncbi:MAG: hypothetical protein HGB20_04940 [Chlorobiaceae bacterium]|nr:hypothetical protein [Chlorobiaceae bacterium]